MYKAVIRAKIRRDIEKLNGGEYQPLLRLAAPDAELTFPGDNSWSRQFRPVRRGRARHATHRGRTELEAFGRRFVDAGLRIDVDDILVNGPPWNTRVCVRATDGTPDGVYANRVAILIEARWGRIHRWEDYLDTERVAEWDRLAGSAPVAAGVPT
jgi:ketosteroid isomerase-like protein